MEKSLEENIRECLIMFGPCDLRTIQQKLDMRGIIRSLNDIDNAAEWLVKFGFIKQADGFNDKAYKI